MGSFREQGSDCNFHTINDSKRIPKGKSLCPRNHSFSVRVTRRRSMTDFPGISVARSVIGPVTAVSSTSPRTRVRKSFIRSPRQDAAGCPDSYGAADPSGSDRSGETRPAEAQLHRRSRIRGRTGVVDRHLVAARRLHLEVPDERILRTRPVHEVGTIRRLAAAPHPAARLPVARRQHRDGEFAVTDRNGPRIDRVRIALGLAALAFLFRRCGAAVPYISPRQASTAAVSFAARSGSRSFTGVLCPGSATRSNNCPCCRAGGPACAR